MQPSGHLVYVMGLWHHDCFLCTVILATSLMEATSYVAYILAYFPHIYTLSNLELFLFVNLRGIFIAGTYRVTAGLYVDHSNNAGGDTYEMW